MGCYLIVDGAMFQYDRYEHRPGIRDSRHMLSHINTGNRMRIPLFRTLLTALLVTITVRVAAHAQEPGSSPGLSFRHLPYGDVITVHYEWSGCFGGESYDLEFRRDSVLRVFVVGDHVVIDPKTNRGYEVAGDTLGTLALSDSDAAGLDILFASYHLESPILSTTTERTTFTQLHGSAVNVTESFTDRSGGMHRDAGVLTFSALIRRFEVKGNKRTR